MDWVQRMNKAIEYVEAHLIERIDTDEISKIMACSFSTFHRSFTQITGITLVEYTRRRKLTLAAYELQNTDMKVIDVTLKYGYSSPDSFRVAFKNLHGISPKFAKLPNTTLKFYSRLEFEVNIKGVYEMNYKMIERNPFKVVGIRKTTPHAGGTWQIVKGDGTFNKLMEQSGKTTSLGLCFGFDKDGNNDYMVGVAWDTDDVLGYDVYEYTDITWLVFVSEGAISDNVLYKTWRRIYDEFLPNSKFVQLGIPTIEKYIEWDEQNDNCKVEVHIPVVKK
ncbi:MAG: AraC family transcriptional regulator [Clostridiales bacterium]|nr:AraC family transcriptional regulator [Clostridiales bacterium]